MREMKAILQSLLADERRLHQAYAVYLPLLHPAILREKLQGRIAEGWKHIQALEQAIEKEGAAPDQAALAPVVPASEETHTLLDFFYQQEERLYYRYQEALKQSEAERLRSLLSAHLQDEEKYLSTIQHLYAEFLYY